MDFPTCVYKLEILLFSFQVGTGRNGLPSENDLIPFALTRFPKKGWEERLMPDGLA